MNLPNTLLERTALFNSHFDDLLFLNAVYLDEEKALNDRLSKLELFLENRIEERADYIEAIIEQCEDSYSFGSSEFIQKVLADPALKCSEVECSLLTWLSSHPATYLFFRILKRIEKNLFEIIDLMSSKTYKIHSPALQSMQERSESRNASYVALTFDNGLCLQTLGMLHYNRLERYDAILLGESIDSTCFKEHGFDRFLKDNPHALYHMDKVSGIPAIDFLGMPMKLHLGSVESIDYDFNPDQWKIEKQGKLVCYTMEKAPDAVKEAWDFPELFEKLGMSNIRVIKMQDHYLLSAFNEKAFSIVSELMGYPELEVDAVYSLSLAFTLEEEGYELPWTPFLFKEEEKEESFSDNQELIKKINTFFSQYTAAYNEGHTLDIKKVSKEIGIDYEMAMDFVRQFEEKAKMNNFTVDEADKQFELEGVPIPPPAMRRNFSNDLYESAVFLIEDSKEFEDTFNVLTDYKYEQMVADEGVVGVFEDIFLDIFEEGSFVGYTSLNSIMWILLNLPDKPVLVRSLALEVCKIFPFIAVNYPLDEYIARLSDAIFRAFCSTALTKITSRPRGEVRRKGLYTIETTKLLRSLMVLRPYRPSHS